MAADDTAYQFSFTETSSFSAGQLISFTFDPTNDANDSLNTIVLRLNPGKGM